MSRSDYVLDYDNFDVNRIIITEPKDEKQGISAKRSHVLYKKEDGTLATLNMATDWLYCYGININVDDKDPDVQTGATLPHCCTDKNGATEAQQKWIDTFFAIIEKIKDLMLADGMRDNIDPDLERSNLKKLCNCMYQARDPKTKKVVEGGGYTLYAKLLYSRKKGEITTQFYDESDNVVDPQEITGKHCYIRSLVRIESIFYGTKYSVQVKIPEAIVRRIDTTRSRLLPRPTVVSQSSVVTKSTSFNPVNDDDDDAGSLKDDDTALTDKVDELTVEEEAPKAVVPVVKKKIVKVLKK